MKEFFALHLEETCNNLQYTKFSTIRYSEYRIVPKKHPWALAAQTQKKLRMGPAWTLKLPPGRRPPPTSYLTRNGAYTSHYHFTAFENHVRVHHRQHHSTISCVQVSVDARNRQRTLHSSGDSQYAWPLCSHHTYGTLTIGHVPAEVCWFFLRRGGTIKCRVSTDRHRRSPLSKAGSKYLVNWSL